MRTFLFAIAGLVLGLVASLVLVMIVGWVLPLLNGGAGRDAMSQGLTGTLVLFFAAPILSVLGVFLGVRKANMKLD